MQPSTCSLDMPTIRDASILSYLCSLDCAATQCDGNGRERQNAHVTDFPRPGPIQRNRR